MHLLLHLVYLGVGYFLSDLVFPRYTFEAFSSHCPIRLCSKQAVRTTQPCAETCYGF